MKIIVDTNLVFSAVLNPNGTIGSILTAHRPVFQFFSCESLLAELKKHRQKMLDLAGLQPSVFEKIQEAILENIEIIEEQKIPFSVWQQSIPFVREVDKLLDDLGDRFFDH